MRARVWFHRISAGVWALIGAVSFAFGLQNSVALVWAASVYANVKSDWGAAEASDNTEILKRLDAIDARQREIIQLLKGENGAT